MSKTALKRRNVTYKDLSVRLEAMGIHETAPDLNNKISRGGFSAVFLIQCLAAAGCQTVRISEDRSFAPVEGVLAKKLKSVQGINSQGIDS